MRIIDRYIISTILLYSAMVLGVLLTLGGLFVFIGQQDDIGVGSYRASDALLFTVLNLPQQAFELMPIRCSSARCWDSAFWLAAVSWW